MVRILNWSLFSAAHCVPQWSLTEIIKHTIFDIMTSLQCLAKLSIMYLAGMRKAINCIWTWYKKVTVLLRHTTINRICVETNRTWLRSRRKQERIIIIIIIIISIIITEFVFLPQLPGKQIASAWHCISSTHLVSGEILLTYRYVCK